MKYKFLIVGAGFFGSTFARLATDAGYKCLVLEKKNHVAGAAYDYTWNNQIISEYGAHIFHTHHQKIWDFVNRFTTMIPFINKPKAISRNKVYSFPINLMTLHQMWGIVTPKEAVQKLQEVRIPCENPRNFEEWALDKIGEELYHKFIYGYTKKQWHKEPSYLPASIIQRLPIRLTYEENYFVTKYQGMPKYGYTDLINNMLENVDIKLGQDFNTIKNNWHDYAEHLVYSGPVDAFYDYTYGKLEYNTLKFVHKIYTGDQQGTAVFNHVDEEVPFLRSVEHRHFYEHKHSKHIEIENLVDKTPSVVTYDYPILFEEHPEPFYPIRDETNTIMYEKYYQLKKSDPKIIFGGRLGEYKYLDLDQTIASAMSKFQTYTKKGV